MLYPNPASCLVKSSRSLSNLCRFLAILTLSFKAFTSPSSSSKPLISLVSNCLFWPLINPCSWFDGGGICLACGGDGKQTIVFEPILSLLSPMLDICTADSGLAAYGLWYEFVWLKAGWTMLSICWSDAEGCWYGFSGLYGNPGCKARRAAEFLYIRSIYNISI